MKWRQWAVSQRCWLQWHTLNLANPMTLHFQPVEARGVEYSWNDAGVFSREGHRAHTTGAWVFSSCVVTGEWCVWAVPPRAVPEAPLKLLNVWECSTNDYYHLLVVAIKLKCETSDKEVPVSPQGPSNCNVSYCGRERFRHCSWDMKATWEPLGHF